MKKSKPTVRQKMHVKTGDTVQVIAGKEVPQAPLREQVRVTFRATAEKSSKRILCL